ncbi:hypothetical protein RND71_032054 [Anisodus tanguticus]|uniref:Uncharacterized protein n=1 Tax=Anisodus tanguticus TaxID=243964 RepID=A0AAE1V5F8_9SOLA|nr:hypothetical protein RND71_032054 [Anisodus tanguticus]
MLGLVKELLGDVLGLNLVNVGARLTMVSTEEIILERPRASGSNKDEAKASGDSLAQIGEKQAGAVLMVCRTYGKKGDQYWTSKWPFKDLAQLSETFMDKPPSAEAPATGGADSQKSAYVPASMRGGAAERASAGGTEMRRRNEENSVRVTNLSEDTREADLLELFRSLWSRQKSVCCH